MRLFSRVASALDWPGSARNAVRDGADHDSHVWRVGRPSPPPTNKALAAVSLPL